MLVLLRHAPKTGPWKANRIRETLHRCNTTLDYEGEKQNDSL